MRVDDRLFERGLGWRRDRAAAASRSRSTKRAIRNDVLHVLHVQDVEPRIENLARDSLRDSEPRLGIGRGRCFPLSTCCAAWTIGRGCVPSAGRSRVDQCRRSHDKTQAEGGAYLRGFAAIEILIRLDRSQLCDTHIGPIAEGRKDTLLVDPLHRP
jgi:hypothetical protein